MIVKWQTEFLNDLVEAEFLALPADMQGSPAENIGIDRTVWT